MDKLDEGILKLAVDRGLLHPDVLNIPQTPDLLINLVKQGKISNTLLESLRAELLDGMRTLADPVWAHLEVTGGQKDEISIAVFGRYIQLRLIGRGGMARVYCGYDPTLGRAVALKLLNEESERLMLEARNQARVEHENVCKVYEVGEVDSKQYICMQYVQGRTLGDVAAEMNLTEKVEVIRKIADAVHSAHKQGLVHRDIKPSNIMLEKTEAGPWKPYILDFGLARLQAAPGITQKGMILGTPHYMPPEQARAETIDMRSDVYSLGATFYELITGRPPFTGTTSEVILKVLQEDAVPVRKIKREIPADLETIVMKCLEKDPAARYQTAKALANDLERYLDGEPISARPVNWSTRVWKKAKKNRVVAVILTSAFVVTALLFSLLIFARWKASVQTRYANDFAEEIRYIETMLLSTYTAPLHDVRPKLTLARQRLQRIEQRIQEGGDWAYGPGNNALGQGYLVLKEYERAREFLQNAWDSGYQSPSTAYALGKVKGILWRQALIVSDRLASRSLQEEARKKADEEYRRPAIQFLKNAREYAESPAYVEALIFLYEKRHKEAFEKSNQALEISSRPYEVLKLQGDIHFEVGQEALKRREYASTLKAFQSAGEAYNRAAEIARSDQDIYLADCERWIRASTAREDHQEEKLADLERALEACDKASIVQPDNEQPYLHKSEAYLQQGISHMYSSGNPRPAFLKAIELARVAGRKNPASPEPHDSAANVFCRLAEYENSSGVDPRKSLNEAITESKKALQLNPQHSSAYFYLAGSYFYLGDYELSHGENPLPSLQNVIEIMQKNLRTFHRDEMHFNLLGLTYLDMGEYRLKHGEDPRPDLAHAIESYQSGLKINPDAFAVYANMGLAYLDVVKYEMSHGIDPTLAFERSIQHYDQCLAVKKDYAFAHHDRGSVYLLRAEHKIRLGDDAKTDLEAAMASYNKALELNPELTYPHMNIGAGHFLSARYLFNSGNNPLTELNAARKALRNYITLDESHYEAFRIRSGVELLAAQWEIRNRRSPDAYFERAITDLRKANELNKNELGVLRDLAVIYRVQTEWRLAQNQSAADSIDRGMETIQHASQLTAEDPETLAIHGSLKLLAAHEAKDVETRKEFAKEAHRLLTKALSANPFLKREYGSLQKQAENFN